MTRIIDLPEIGEPDQPQEPKKFDMPRTRFSFRNLAFWLLSGFLGGFLIVKIVQFIF